MYYEYRPVLSKEEALLSAKLFADRMNCKDDKQWLECLRGVDANLFVTNYNSLTFPTDGTEFLPVLAQKSSSDLAYNQGEWPLLIQFYIK